MDTLKDKVAIVTGASRGIGRGIALRFAREGARIVGFATSPKNLEKLSGEIRQAGGTCEVVAGSVAKSADVDRLVVREG